MRTYYELVDEPIKNAWGHKYYGVDRPWSSRPGPNWEHTPAADVFRDYVCAPWEELNRYSQGRGAKLGNV